MSVLEVARVAPVPALPHWPDGAHLRRVLAELRERPALVGYERCRALGAELARVAVGRAFVVHAGDCAELFGDVSARLSARKVAQLHDLTSVLAHASGRPAVALGRIAGQFAKPRSCVVEQHRGESLPVYRGDAVNDLTADAAARRPDAGRLLTAYDKADEILRHLGSRRRPLDLYSSHDALLCEFEQALVRIDPASGERYASSAHLLWAGERTRTVDGPHIELLASVANPVAVKLGPHATPGDVAGLVEALDPDRRPGRLVLIARIGADVVERRLGPLVEAAHGAGAQPVWLCDPMHANTFHTAHGRKTRAMSDILREVTAFVRVMRSAGGHPGGLHLEATPNRVTECVETRDDGLSPSDLPRYRSGCDPRLNAGQARRVVGAFAQAVTP